MKYGSIAVNIWNDKDGSGFPGFYSLKILRVNKGRKIFYFGKLQMIIHLS